MIDFSPLESLYGFDFTQMRALDGKRATDETIFDFVNRLNTFYNQVDISKLQHLSNEEKEKYTKVMTKIIDKINEAEIAYYKRKHETEGEPFEDYSVYAVSLRKLPERMQYWAAGKGFGDAIRNPDLYKKVTKNMTAWEKVLTQSKENTPSTFFKRSLEDAFPIRKKSRVNKESDDEQSENTNRNKPV